MSYLLSYLFIAKRERVEFIPFPSRLPRNSSVRDETLFYHWTTMWYQSYCMPVNAGQYPKRCSRNFRQQECSSTEGWWAYHRQKKISSSLIWSLHGILSIQIHISIAWGLFFICGVIGQHSLLYRRTKIKHCFLCF